MIEEKVMEISHNLEQAGKETNMWEKWETWRINLRGPLFDYLEFQKRYWKIMEEKTLDARRHNDGMSS